MPSGTIKVNKPPPMPIVGPPPKSTKYKGVKHTIMVMSGKGGVGKSTVAVNLAVTLAQQGLKVGVIDADINGPDDPKMLGVDREKVYADESGISPVDTKYGVKVISMAFLLPTEETAVVWRGALRHKAIQQFIEDVVWKDMDYVILDLPPGTGDEALSIAQIVPEVEGVVIVITPQDVALLDARKAINFADQMKIKVLGVIENMSGFVCPHCGEVSYIFKTGGGEKAAKDHNVPFLGRIPLSQDVVETADEGVPIVTRNGKMREIFSDIASKITQKTSA
ncbi:MAG: Mrp/NBP35 family ATP-binding protein [Candidatus Thermoplasmatota archaeon]|jgi:ATP-binding protein involved in chromosome partitioning|nr:Mrp/NBP35 family ATP-binding protein [Candidatus Thermoplasmatota archaeon]